MIAEGSEAVFWKTRLFLSFHKTHANQTTCKNEWEHRGIPAILENWTKWFRITPSGTEEMPNQFQTWDQTVVLKLQPKKRCSAVSWLPQPTTHVVSFDWRTRLRNKLSLVGILSRKKRQTNNDTFDGICWCQTLTTRFLSTGSTEVVIKQYVPLTE